MQYTNIKLPIATAWLDTDEDILTVLKAFVGHDCVPCGEPLHYEASIGRSSYGPWVEGDIDFMDDGLCCSLAYDFMQDGEIGRVFRYEIDRHPELDQPARHEGPVTSFPAQEGVPAPRR